MYSKSPRPLSRENALIAAEPPDEEVPTWRFTLPRRLIECAVQIHTENMASSELSEIRGLTHGHDRETSSTASAKIRAVEYFRVRPRWLFVKITDDEGNYGWGEATLEGHSKAVEGALDEIIDRVVGLEAE
jgi:hypothetical protein